MSKILKKSYIYFILALFYIPLFVGAVFSFSTSAKKGDMPMTLNVTNEGWINLFTDLRISYAFWNTVLISLIVAIVAVSLSLLTVFGLWRQKNILVKGYVQGTQNIPLINPDVVTAVSLSVAFGLMFGVLQRGNSGFERVIITQIVAALPFAIAIMYPKSQKFKQSVYEASKDMGYGPVKTWFKTYFRYMIGISMVAFIISIALSFNDFIITRIVSKEKTIGKIMYEGSLKPWVLAAGTVVLIIVLSVSIFSSLWMKLKEKKTKHKAKEGIHEK